LTLTNFFLENLFRQNWGKEREVGAILMEG